MLFRSGIDPQQLLDAMTISISNVATTQKTKTDTAATVHVTADSKITFDATKFRAIMKTVLAAQGKPTDDQTLDLVMNAVSSQLTTTQKIDEDVQLVNEGGKWVICG